MNKTRRLALTLLLVLSLSAALLALAGCESASPETLIANNTANSETDAAPGLPEETSEPTADWEPDIRFTTLDEKGNAWTDACFRYAKLTMINYWAYWCGPCVGEMPDIQKLSEVYAPRGLQVLGLSDESYEEDNIETMAELGVTYPCLRYTSDFDPYMNTGYIPDTVFVDENGKVLGEVYIGSNSYEDWAAIIESLLA